MTIEIGKRRFSVTVVSGSVRLRECGLFLHWKCGTMYYFWSWWDLKTTAEPDHDDQLPPPHCTPTPLMGLGTVGGGGGQYQCPLLLNASFWRQCLKFQNRMDRFVGNVVEKEEDRKWGEWCIVHLRYTASKAQGALTVSNVPSKTSPNCLCMERMNRNNHLKNCHLAIFDWFYYILSLPCTQPFPQLNVLSSQLSVSYSRELAVHVVLWLCTFLWRDGIDVCWRRGLPGRRCVVDHNRFWFSVELNLYM